MKLETIRTIEGQIRVITGLHIGASNDTIEIGGLDNPIIKTPMGGEPYIPGSSLKGKLRSLIEIRTGQFVREGRSKGNPCDCGKRTCSICAVFGTSAIANRADDLGPTRIVCRDAHLSKRKDENAKSWKEIFDSGELTMEIKYENAINRITGVANPRPLERVPAGVEFDFAITFKQFEEDSEDYFNTLKRAMKLLELDALGGSGSRGCGQIEFVNIRVDDKDEPNFLKSVEI